MTLHVVYSNATGSTQDLTNLKTIRLPTISLTTNAEEGSVAISNLVVDDVGGTLDLVGLRRVYIWESAESPLNQMIWTGFLGAREISRGPGQPIDDDTFVVGADRRWSCELTDVNSLFSRRIITGADGNRPAETDVQRITWLIGTNYVFTVGTGDSAGYFNKAGGVAMDAADLRGQTAFDVMNECAQRSGKNWFMFYDEGTETSPPTYVGRMSLFYDFATSTTYSSALRLTNIAADVDNSTTFAVLPDMILRRDPGRVFSGVYLPYDGGTLYAQNAATGDTYAYRDTAAPNADVKTVEKAQALADRYLSDAGSEDDRITCRFVAPKEKVNGLREGQRVQIKFSHLPNYSSSYGYARCLRRTVTQKSQEAYEIEVELSAATSGSRLVLVGHSPTDHTAPTPYQTADGTPITWTAVFANPADLTLFAAGGSGGRTQVWHATVPGGTTGLKWALAVNSTMFFAFEFGGIGAADASNWAKFESGQASGSSSNISASGSVLLLGGVMTGGNFDRGGHLITQPAGWTEQFELLGSNGGTPGVNYGPPQNEVSTRILTAASGNYSYDPSFSVNQQWLAYIVRFPALAGQSISLIQKKERDGIGGDFASLTFDSPTGAP